MNRAVGVGMAIVWFMFVLGATVVVSLRVGIMESLGFFVCGGAISVAVLFGLVPRLPTMQSGGPQVVVNVGAINNYYYGEYDTHTGEIYPIVPAVDTIFTRQLELLKDEERIIEQLLAHDQSLMLAPPAQKVKVEVIESPQPVKQLKEGRR